MDAARRANFLRMASRCLDDARLAVEHATSMCHLAKAHLQDAERSSDALAVEMIAGSCRQSRTDLERWRDRLAESPATRKEEP